MHTLAALLVIIEVAYSVCTGQLSCLRVGDYIEKTGAGELLALLIPCDTGITSIDEPSGAMLVSPLQQVLVSSAALHRYFLHRVS